MRNAAYISQVIITYAFLLGVVIFSKWKIFEKAGIRGWKAVIPFYSYYMLVTKVARKSQTYFWAPITIIFIMIQLRFFLLEFDLEVMRGEYPFYDREMRSLFIIVSIIYLALVISLLVMTLKLYIAIAKNFGEDTGFGVGLIILYIPFHIILAFGDYKFSTVDQKSKGKKLRDSSKNLKIKTNMKKLSMWKM